MARISEQVEWFSLVDISGPFLAAFVIEQVFPQGLEKINTPLRQRLRSAYDEWRDAVDDNDPQLSEMHSAWVLMVLQDLLEYEDSVLVSREALGGDCVYSSPEHGVEVVPDYVVRGDDGKFRMLVSVWPPETDLEKPVSSDSWPASPLERMTLLCRANDVRVGLVTDGERWMVVNAPVEATSGYTAWLARLWWQEPVTLKAFQSLLGVRRCFGPKEDTLDALLVQSTEFQEEVTDTLGEQVRRAVEILVQSLGRVDQDRNGELLKGVRPAELYEAGLTVMMRLVFTLCAEERGLLLLGDPAYDQNYAISTLRAELREDADRLGVEVLERRHDAWSRILAVFRAIYGGVEHESLRMPALGGSLYDPDRFPFLEGRAKGTSWRETSAIPLPIDNRTVLLLLDALQVLEQRAGAQLLSYRALDVGQIGHVYEGLLEYTVIKLDEITVGLVGSQRAGHSSITLSELESLKSQEHEKAVERLVELTGRTTTTVDKTLTRGGDETALLKLVHACGGEEPLARRLLPFAGLIRADSWGTMLVYQPNSFAVVHGSNRRETGTHYTPELLTENIVERTLEQVVYAGPAKGAPREKWILKAPSELLDLKVCDPAMGSGAFLVQVCHYLSKRLVEAWANEENKGKSLTIDGFVLNVLGDEEQMPKSLNERIIIARRLIAERCLYGVDINPLAVELAKLSIWLVTMAKGLPFGFLDHNLRSGDSLLGIHRLVQLKKLTMNPDDTGRQERLFGQNIGSCVEEAISIRTRLRAVPIRDISDVEKMARLNSEVRKKLESVELVADAMIGEALCCCGNSRVLDVALDSLAILAGDYLSGDKKMGELIASRAKVALSSDLTEGKSSRKPFHWPFEFPEVFRADEGGFDALVGNPPFMGGRKIRGALGAFYLAFLTRVAFEGSSANADLCSFFFRRASELISQERMFGFLATNSICQGGTREVGLGYLESNGFTIANAVPSLEWPGNAGVSIALLWIYKGVWGGQRHLDGKVVTKISSHLTTDTIDLEPQQLDENKDFAFQGSNVLGNGFVLTQKEALDILANNENYRKVIKPFLRGEDFNSRPDLSPAFFIIDFFDWPLDRLNQATAEAIDVASDYPKCLSIVKDRVYPERLRAKSEAYRSSWWQYARLCKSLYESASGLQRVIFHAYTSKNICFGFADTGIVYSGPHTVITSESYGQFAIFQSSIHSEWAWTYSSTMRNSGIRFTPSDVRKFPRPPETTHLVISGQQYYTFRSELMRSENQGLTTVYNRLNDPKYNSDKINKFRALLIEVDHAVINSYGWDGLILNHGFQKTKQGIRFTISEDARAEVLRRLLQLNHQRYENEVIAGLHDREVQKNTDDKGCLKDKKIAEELF